MAANLPSRHALIVDDEFLIAFDLESSMRELGFDVCTVASNEKDAIELAKSNAGRGGYGCVFRRDSCRNRDGKMAPRGMWRAYRFCDRSHDDGTLERIHEVVPGAPVLSKPVYRETLAHAVSEAVH
jgi:hypothetical protein